MRFAELLAATMADVEHVYDFTLNGEQYAVRVSACDHRAADAFRTGRKDFPAPAEQRFGKVREDLRCFFQLPKPPQARFARLLREQPFQNRVSVLPSASGVIFNAEGHALRAILRETSSFRPGVSPGLHAFVSFDHG